MDLSTLSYTYEYFDNFHSTSAKFENTKPIYFQFQYYSKDFITNRKENQKFILRHCLHIPLFHTSYLLFSRPGKLVPQTSYSGNNSQQAENSFNTFI